MQILYDKLEYSRKNTPLSHILSYGMTFFWSSGVLVYCGMTFFLVLRSHGLSWGPKKKSKAILFDLLDTILSKAILFVRTKKCPNLYIYISVAFWLKCMVDARNYCKCKGGLLQSSYFWDCWCWMLDGVSPTPPRSLSLLTHASCPTWECPCRPVSSRAWELDNINHLDFGIVQCSLSVWHINCQCRDSYQSCHFIGTLP